MSRETRAIANANHALNLLDRYVGSGPIHIRDSYISRIRKLRRTLTAGSEVVDRLERVTSEAEHWVSLSWGKNQPY